MTSVWWADDPDERELEMEVRQPEELLPDIETQNIVVLSLLLVLGKLTTFIKKNVF